MQKMQYEQGDVLLCDVTVPAGIDPHAAAAPAATQLPKVLPEQLVGRSVVKNFGGLPVNGKVMLVSDDMLVCKFDVDGVSDWELTVDEVLNYLVGPAPVPEQLEPEAEPDEEEKEAAIKLFFNGIRPRLKKKNSAASSDDLRKLADAEWLALPPDRRLHYVHKIRQRSAAAVQGGGGAAASRVLKRGEPVPARLWGRAKGMQALLAERGLQSGLRGACENQEAHGAPKLPRVRRPSEAWADEVGQPG